IGEVLACQAVGRRPDAERPHGVVEKREFAGTHAKQAKADVINEISRPLDAPLNGLCEAFGFTESFLSNEERVQAAVRLRPVGVGFRRQRNLPLLAVTILYFEEKLADVGGFMLKHPIHMSPAVVLLRAIRIPRLELQPILLEFLRVASFLKQLKELDRLDSVMLVQLVNTARRCLSRLHGAVDVVGNAEP